tara:strand:- start:8905 stop:9282 length:378 start_codon:yes stop_codon:yes gene_type:complete
MAQELNYYGHLVESGLTVVAKVYNKSGVQVGGDVSCSEVGILSIYIGDMPTLLLGEYGVRFFSGTTLLGQGNIFWNGTEEVEVLTIETKVDVLDSEIEIIDNKLLTVQHSINVNTELLKNKPNNP